MKQGMTILRHWLHSRRLVLLFAALFVAVLFAVYGLYGLPWGTAGYAALLGCSIGGVLGMLDFIRFANRHRTLQKLCARFPTGALPQPADLLGADYTAIILALEAERVRLVNENAARQKEAEEYYTLWVHQIKTPIASAGLLLQAQQPQMPPGLGAKLSGELFRIEQYAGMALGYQRLATIHEDLQFETHSVAALVKKAVKNSATLFISKNLAVDTEGATGEVVTDEKWFVFVLEQLLGNAAKYTTAGKVTIYTEADGTLVVEDTGIGIAAEDLPRVFQRGFTGGLGRVDKRSTGLGLWLCREVCSKLGFGISIESKQGQGTRVLLALRQARLEHE